MARHSASASRTDSSLPGFYFVAYGALGAFLPYFPPWLENHGFVGLRMSLIMALVPALAALVPPIVGHWADTRGARGNLLMALAAVAGVGMLALSALDALGAAESFPLVLLAFLPFVCCRPAVIMMADRIALEGGGNYGTRRLWGSLGFLAVALATGHYVTADNQSQIPLVVGALLSLSALVAWRLPRSVNIPAAESKTLKKVDTPLGREPALKNPRFLVFLLITALFQIANISYQLCGTLFFRDLGASGTQTGLLWGVGVVAEVGVMLGAKGLMERYRPETLLTAAMLTGVLRWGVTSVLTSPGPAFVTQALHGITFGLTLLCSLAFVKQVAPTRHLGKYQGLFMMAQSIGGVLGTLLWGPIYAGSGGGRVFGTAAALCLLSATVAYAGLYRRSRATQPST